MIHVDPNPQEAADLETLAAKLEAAGTYRVLRKLAPRPAIEPPAGIRVRQGLFVDTETTGLDPARDEIIELAMVPFTYGLDGQVYAVGEPFQQLREPSKSIPAEITALTGIDDAMVAGKRIDPNEVAHAAAPASLVVAHNAAFDRGFINSELTRMGRPTLADARWIDTLQLAQKRFPGMSNSLDSLCKRFKISLADREKHGALIDSQLLAAVYLELRGGREKTFDLDPVAAAGAAFAATGPIAHGPRPRPLAPRSTEAERADHAAFVGGVLKDKAIWLKFGMEVG